MNLESIKINIPRSEFIKKLQSLTIPITIEKINLANKKDRDECLENTLNQDYDEIDMRRNIEQDVFYDIQIPKQYIFAGEVNESSIKLFLPRPKRDKSFSYEFIHNAFGEDFALVLKKFEDLENETQRYNAENWKSAKIDGSRLFYYEIKITEQDQDTQLKIIKHKFTNEDDASLSHASPLGIGSSLGFMAAEFKYLLIFIGLYLVLGFLEYKYLESNFAKDYPFFFLWAVLFGYVVTIFTIYIKTQIKIEDARAAYDEIIVFLLEKLSGINLINPTIEEPKSRILDLVQVSKPHQ
jgi:hypothetical protein